MAQSIVVFVSLVIARQQSCGKVMFSVVSVHGDRGGGSHGTITHDALGLAIHGPSQVCLNLFIMKNVRLVGKRAVLIPLVCFLVQKDFVKWMLLENPKRAMIIPFLGGLSLHLNHLYSIAHDNLRLAIWDTSFWTFLLKFGHKGP